MADYDGILVGGQALGISNEEYAAASSSGSGGFNADAAIPNIANLGLNIVGTGLGIYGAIEGMKAAHEQSDISQKEVGVEIQQNAVRKQQVQLDYNRASMQGLRQSQMARSMAINSATGQGAQFGSGLQGGLAGISGQAGVNQLGLNQNLDLSNQMFGLSDQLNALKQQYAKAGTKASDAQGLIGIGKSISGLGGKPSLLGGGGIF